MNRLFLHHLVEITLVISYNESMMAPTSGCYQCQNAYVTTWWCKKPLTTVSEMHHYTSTHSVIKHRLIFKILLQCFDGRASGL